MAIAPELSAIRGGPSVSPDRGHSFSQSRQDRQDRPFHGIQIRFFARFAPWRECFFYPVTFTRSPSSIKPFE